MEFSGDFRRSLDALNEAFENAVAELSNENQAARATVNRTITTTGRCIDEMLRLAYPEMSKEACSKCNKKIFTETAYWSGTCFECGLM